MKRWKYWVGLTVLGVGSLLLAFAQGVLAEEEIDQAVLDNISQNCNSIKQSLTDLQRADSRTRTYLGSAYESVARDFITPLNLRLVKNNRVETGLMEVQSKFTEQQTEFRSEYTAYMRELEGLLALNCQKQPAAFYRQLEKTREHRLKLHNIVEILNKLVTQQAQSVSKLREEL